MNLLLFDISVTIPSKSIIDDFTEDKKAKEQISQEKINRTKNWAANNTKTCY